MRKLRELAVPLSAAVAALALWDTPIVFPLKILVVFLHEISHGLAAIATGGSILRIEVGSNEGGHCLTQGGSPWAIFPAGYLGSMFWGAALLVAGIRTRWDRVLVGGLALGGLAVTVLFVRTLFGFSYGLATAAALALVALRAPERVSDALLRIVGTVSCLYAVRDIADDLILRTAAESDASGMARLTGIPAPVWGVLWMLLALGVAAGALVFASRGAPTEVLPPAGSGGHPLG